MSWSALVDKTTGKFYDSLIPQGGGVSLQKGQIITALAGGTEVAFPNAPPADGTILSYDSNELTGLKYIAVPGAVPLSKGQLLSGNAANVPTIVTAPAFPAQEGYVLTATAGAVDGTGLEWKNAGQTSFTAQGQMQYGGAGPGFADTNLNIGTAGQILKVNPGATAPEWVDVGGGGVVTATAPLVENAVGSASQVSINFAAGPAGQIPYGNGTALTGALTNTPTAGQILGVSGGVPAWINPGGSGTITAVAPLVENAVSGASQISINFTTKAQIPVGTGAGTGALLPQSATDGYVLTAAASESTGLKWVPGGSPAAQTNFYELTFPGNPPFTNVGNVVTLPAPSTIATFTKNEQITIMNYEPGAAAGGNTFTFSAYEWGQFRGGIAGLNTGGNENYFYYAYFVNRQTISLYRAALPLSASSSIGEYLGGVTLSTSNTARVNGFCRTANYIYVYGLFDGYTPSGVAPNTTPFTSVGNVLKYNMATGAFSVLCTAVGQSGLYVQAGEGVPQIYCACACPTTDKANGSYASRPHSIVFGGSFTTAINSTLVCQYVAYYEEGADTFNTIADPGAAGVSNPAQTPSADGEALFGASAVLFNPDNNGLVMVFNFTSGIYSPTPSVSQAMTNGVIQYQNVTLPFIYGLGTSGQINNSKNVEYAAGLVRKASDSSMWLLLAYTDNAPTQNCWWYNLAGAGSGDAFVTPISNPTPPLQVSSGGCDLPQNFLYGYGYLNDSYGRSPVSWINPPIVSATYPDGGTYIWVDSQGTADTYVTCWAASDQIQLTYTGLNNGAKSWASTPDEFAAMSLNQSLLPGIVTIYLAPGGEGSRRGASLQITDQFVGVLAFAGNGLQYIASPTATGFSVTKQVVFKTQYSSLQLVVDTAADIYRVVNQYGNIEYT